MNPPIMRLHGSRAKVKAVCPAASQRQSVSPVRGDGNTCLKQRNAFLFVPGPVGLTLPTPHPPIVALPSRPHRRLPSPTPPPFTLFLSHSIYPLCVRRFSAAEVTN